LDYELDHNASLSDDIRFRELIGRNLFSSNAFNETATFNTVEPFINKGFDAVVGNPPWTQSKANHLATNYCKRKRPDEGYPGGYPIARSENPDQAFLWRVGDFANENTSIGLILHSKPFFSNTQKAWRAKEALFKRFKPRVVINLSKLRRDRLFPNSEAPAMVFIGKGCKSQQKDSFYLVCPERSLDFRQHGIIEISPENIKRLPVYAIATDPDMLKVASWAGARDSCLIQKLRTEFPCIEEVIGKPISNGFKAGIGKEVPEELLLKKWLSSGEMQKYQVDSNKLGLLLYIQMESSRKPEIYDSPLVIISQTPDPEGVYSAFSEEVIVYTQRYSGISFSYKQVKLAHYINAIINSAVASYFLFLTSASWGVERDEVKTQDLSRLPVPTPSAENANLISQIVAIEHQLRTSSSAGYQSLKNQLNEAVFELYSLDQTEKVLVEDGVNLTINLRMEREASIALSKPTLDELKLYALQLIGVIQPFLQTLRERVLVADVLEVSKSPLQVVKFSFVPAPGREQIVQTTQVQELKTVLNRIAEQLPQQIADRIYTRRDLRIYTGQDIYIIKPAQKRYWSRSAGLNDADLIISEHLRVNRAAIR